MTPHGTLLAIPNETCLGKCASLKTFETERLPKKNFKNIECLRKALRSVFDDAAIDDITATDLSGEYPAIQYVPPSGTFHIDIMNRLGEAFGFDDIEVEDRIVEGIHVPVATPRMLYRMKKDTFDCKTKRTRKDCVAVLRWRNDADSPTSLARRGGTKRVARRGRPTAVAGREGRLDACRASLQPPLSAGRLQAPDHQRGQPPNGSMGSV